MSSIALTTFLNEFSWIKSFVFRFKFLWNLFPTGPIDSKSALVQFGAKPLPKPMLMCSTRGIWVNLLIVEANIITDGRNN